jgi:hypothetical protein
MIYSGLKVWEPSAQYSSRQPLRVRWRIESLNCDWSLQKLARLDLPASEFRISAAQIIVDAVGVGHIHHDAIGYSNSSCVRNYRRISVSQAGGIGFRPVFIGCRLAQQSVMVVLRPHDYAFASRAAFSAFF